MFERAWYTVGPGARGREPGTHVGGCTQWEHWRSAAATALAAVGGVSQKEQLGEEGQPTALRLSRERFTRSKAKLAFSETSDASGALGVGRSQSLDQDT